MAPTSTAEALEKNRPIVISGPSGAGKSTILKKLFDEFPDKFGFSVSHTTRQPRAGEQNGREYYFVPESDFVDLISKDGFVEHAQFESNRYGTSKATVASIAETGKICILDIEMEGVKQVARLPPPGPDVSFPRPRFLFLAPPSYEVLEQRLRGRATDSEDAINKRLTQAKKELEFSESPDAPFELIVVNDDLEEAYKTVRAFIIGDKGS